MMSDGRPLSPSLNPLKGHQRGASGQELGDGPEVRGNFMRAELERRLGKVIVLARTQARARARAS